MRLIDADALIVEMCSECGGVCETHDGEKCLSCRDCQCEMRMLLERAETVKENA